MHNHRTNRNINNPPKSISIVYFKRWVKFPKKMGNTVNIPFRIKKKVNVT